MNQDTPGYAADLPVASRPGVPHQLDDRSTDEVPRESTLPRQPPTVRFYKHAGREELTPVFGTAAPPRGLSGVLRARAYAIPEDRARHFLLLLLADRVDVMEHTLLPRLPFLAAFAVGAGLWAKRAPLARWRRTLH